MCLNSTLFPTSHLHSLVVESVFKCLCGGRKMSSRALVELLSLTICPNSTLIPSSHIHSLVVVGVFNCLCGGRKMSPRASFSAFLYFLILRDHEFEQFYVEHRILLKWLLVGVSSVSFLLMKSLQLSFLDFKFLRLRGPSRPYL